MKTTTTDQLVTSLTAFRSLADMRASMDDGYVPSLYGGPNRAARDAKAELAARLRALGYAVFTGL